MLYTLYGIRTAHLDDNRFVNYRGEASVHHVCCAETWETREEALTSIRSWTNPGRYYEIVELHAPRDEKRTTE